MSTLQCDFFVTVLLEWLSYTRQTMPDETADKRSRPLRSDGLTTPRPDRFTPADSNYEACLSAHAAAQLRGDMGYLDPTSGLFVMTAALHADRGFCCERGCRHCPYEPEPS